VTWSTQHQGDGTLTLCEKGEGIGPENWTRCELKTKRQDALFLFNRNGKKRKDFFRGQETKKKSLCPLGCAQQKGKKVQKPWTREGPSPGGERGGENVPIEVKKYQAFVMKNPGGRKKTHSVFKREKDGEKTAGEKQISYASTEHGFGKT